MSAYLLLMTAAGLVAGGSLAAGSLWGWCVAMGVAAFAFAANVLPEELRRRG